MTLTEQKILDLLKKGRDMGCFTAVRAEFEAEGAHPDEIGRLLDLGRRADLEFVLKIGGCEAVRDLKDAKTYGASRVIAPMIESPYAAQKFAGAIEAVYGDLTTFSNPPVFLINLETAQGIAQQDAILNTLPASIQGVVFGRVDYVLSKGWGRDMVDSDAVQQTALTLGEVSRHYSKKVVLGGGVSPESLTFLRSVHAQTPLWAFETRKIAFDPVQLSTPIFQEALETAAYAEYLWLQNKRAYYMNLADADQTRLELLHTRFQSS